MGQLPITWDYHLRQLPQTSSWLRQGARRHWQRAASNDAQGKGGWRRQTDTMQGTGDWNRKGPRSRGTRQRSQGLIERKDVDCILGIRAE
jgi:hypothetical protein